MAPVPARAELGMRIVIVESPYAGDIKTNTEYLRACLRDCLLRGEAPFASHALYTLPGVLEDSNPDDRWLGIEAGFAFWRAAELVAFYADLGISPGMQAALDRAVKLGKPHTIRSLICL